MSADRLRALLAEGGISVGNVPRLDALCKDWFMAEPNTATCILHFLFRELAGAWDDPQGVPTAEHDVFEKRLLPCLITLATYLSARPAETPVAALDDLARAYRDCCRTTSRQPPSSSAD